MVGPKKQDFWPQINILKGKKIKNPSMNDCSSKFGITLENKVVQKLKLENTIHKNGLLN